MKIKPGTIIEIESRFGSVERYLYCGSIRIDKRRYRLIHRTKYKCGQSSYWLVNDDWPKMFKRVEVHAVFPVLAGKYRERFFEHVQNGDIKVEKIGAQL